MTTTPHGQVPEALIDLIDAYAETRHRCGGIYNARTEAARNAVIEALSGVQALSAAPEAKKSALRTYPNPIVPLIKPVSEQEKMRALYLASSNLMAYLGRNGAIHSDGHAADVLMNCLNDLDGGEFDETLFAASPTPPAEQQAAPKAEPEELSAHQILAITTAYEQGVGKGHQAYKSGKEITNPYDSAYGCDLAWQYGYKEGKEQAAPKAAPEVGNNGFDHQTAADFLSGKTVSDEAVRKFVAASRWAHDERAALSATLLAMHGVLTSREAEIALLKKALMEAEAAPQQEAQEPVVAAVFDEQLGRPMLVEGAPMLSHGQPLYTAPQPAPDCHHRPPCDECAALAAQGGK